MALPRVARPHGHLLGLRGMFHSRREALPGTLFSEVERVAWPSVAAAVDKFNDGSVPSAVAADVPQLALHAGS